jgi:hypothetical protein
VTPIIGTTLSGVDLGGKVSSKTYADLKCSPSAHSDSSFPANFVGLPNPWQSRATLQHTTMQHWTTRHTTERGIE